MTRTPRLRLATLNRAHVLLHLRLAFLLSVLFVVIYGGANWIGGRHANDALYHLYLNAELRIPFVPGMIFVYHSIQLLLFVTPLLLLDDDGLRRLAKAMAVAIVVSGVLFLAFPAQLGFPRPAMVAGYERIFTLLYAVDLPHNLVPSLHVSLSGLTVLACARRQPPWAGFLLWTWLVALSVSVLLVHQHHLLDIAGGLMVAAASYSWVYRAPARSPVSTMPASGGT